MSEVEIFCKNCSIVDLNYVDERAAGSKHPLLATAIRHQDF
jgi:hypothetical protein